MGFNLLRRGSRMETNESTEVKKPRGPRLSLRRDPNKPKPEPKAKPAPKAKPLRGKAAQKANTPVAKPESEPVLVPTPPLSLEPTPSKHEDTPVVDHVPDVESRKSDTPPADDVDNERSVEPANSKVSDAGPADEADDGDSDQAAGSAPEDSPEALDSGNDEDNASEVSEQYADSAANASKHRSSECVTTVPSNVPEVESPKSTFDKVQQQPWAVCCGLLG